MNTEDAGGTEAADNSSGQVCRCAVKANTLRRDCRNYAGFCKATLNDQDVRSFCAVPDKTEPLTVPE